VQNISHGSQGSVAQELSPSHNDVCKQMICPGTLSLQTQRGTGGTQMAQKQKESLMTSVQT
jgi:hypothetical protein